jgi:hypothetical protein
MPTAPTVPPPAPISSPTPAPTISLPSGYASRDIYLADALGLFEPRLNDEWLRAYDYFVVGFNADGYKNPTDYTKLVFLVNGQRYEDYGITRKKIPSGSTWSSLVL